jgi:hypothetical protein
VRARQWRGNDRLSPACRRRKGARGPAPLPGLERYHGRVGPACSCNRRRPRCFERSRISCRRGGGDRCPGDASIGRPGGGAFGPWSHHRHQPPGRRRRRSRRRLARINRRDRRARGQGHEPAAWRSHPDGRLGTIAARGGQDCPRGIGRVAHRRAARGSAAPGGRSPSCT